MGGKQDDQNVIIPDTGAGPYWYVDRASGVPSPSTSSTEAYSEPTPLPTPDDLIGRAIEQDQDAGETTAIYKGDDGLQYILPTFIDGQRLSDEEAIERFKKTGEHKGVFMTGDFSF